MIRFGECPRTETSGQTGPPVGRSGLFHFHPMRKEGNGMTMPKYDANNIWTRVRNDVDVDDLIFQSDGLRTVEDERPCSDR